MFNEGILKSRLDELGLVRETAFECLFSYWFKLKEMACEGVCRSMMDQVMAAKAAGSTILGVQIRAGDLTFYKPKKSCPMEATLRFMKCVTEIVMQLRERGRNSTVLLLSDSIEVRKAFQSAYGPNLLVRALLIF